MKNEPRLPQSSPYRLIRLLGDGSFGSVYIASCDAASKPSFVAMKFIPKHLRESGDQEEMFLTRLSHPYIVSIVDSFETQNHKCIVEELCDSDLFETITNGIDIKTAIVLFTELCSAVDYCHSLSIFHRDLKPENVLIKNGTVKLADFGLASDMNLSDEFNVGSARFMSPEVFVNDFDRELKLPYLAASSDVWSLGVILINLLTGRNPWRAPAFSDRAFQFYFARRNKSNGRNNNLKFRRAFQKIFRFSDPLLDILENVFNLNPFERLSVKEFAKAVSNIGEFFIGEDETYGSYDETDASALRSPEM